MIIYFIIMGALIVYLYSNADLSSGAEIQKIAANEKVEISDQITELQKVNTTYPEIRYEGFSVYFDAKHHIPRAAAYELTTEESEGTIPRESRFYADVNVEGCATLDDYKDSGYDRGHMAPAGDFKWSKEAMHGTFSLANICPQVSALNTGAWNGLEKNVRKWVKRDHSLIIITGPIFETGKRIKTIGKNKVAVPHSFYKIILAPQSNQLRAIAFIMPNKDVAPGLKKYATTVREVENATGLDFFAVLPDDIEEQVETNFDYELWKIAK